MNAERSIDAAFVAIVALAAVALFNATAGAWFAGDDWGLLAHDGILEPYNDHLSISIVAIYQGLGRLFGLTYGPFRAVGVLCLIAVPVTFYITTRRTLGPALAAVAGLSTLGLARTELPPATLNHYLVLIGAIVCAWALNRGHDWTLASGVVLALTAAGGGMAVAAACLLHNACTRAPLRRWVAAGAPIALWVAWWATYAQDSQYQPDQRPTGGLWLAAKVAVSPFDIGPGALTAALVAGFVAYGIWSLVGGLAHAANWVAWTGALGAWSMGLVLSRGDRGITDLYGRYQLLALGFALLAMVPRELIRWPNMTPAVTFWLAGAVVAIAIGRGVTVRDDVQARGDWIAAVGRANQCAVTHGDLAAEQRIVLDRYRFDGRTQCETTA